jgi:hypothetical protein
MRTNVGASSWARYNSSMPKSEIIFSVQESPEGGYEARAVGHAIFTRADSMDELQAAVSHAISRHFGDVNQLPMAQLVKVNRVRFGSAKGEFIVPDDFNDPLPKDIEDLFYNSPLFPED